MKSIYEIYIPVKNQEQADRLKAICLEYGLPIWDWSNAFNLIPQANYKNYFFFNNTQGFNKFAIWGDLIDNKTESIEEEFINLLKEMKK